LKELEEKKLKYIGGIAKNRNILVKNKSGISEAIRRDEYAIGGPMKLYKIGQPWQNEHFYCQ
jgi:hypothetical protein